MTTETTSKFTQLLGVVPQFDCDVNKWHIFQAQLEQYFVVNDIDSTKRKPILLTAISEKSFVLLQNLLHPKIPTESNTTYSNCVEVLGKHFTASTSCFAERAKFYAASKSPSESISDWAVRVRALAMGCNFSMALETTMRDKFVMGLEKGPVRDRIFLEDAASCPWQKVLDIATSAEYLQKQREVTVKEEPREDLLHMRYNKGGKRYHQQNHHQQQQLQQQKHHQKGQRNDQRQQQQGRCTVCGFGNHISADCRYRDYRCRKCGSVGHLKKMCRSNHKQLNYVQSSEAVLYTLCENDEPIKIKVLIDKKPFCFELDTGSTYSIVSLGTFKEYFKSKECRETNIVLKSYTGVAIRPTGMCDMKVTFNGRSNILSFLIIPGGGPPLLGRDFIRKFNLSCAQINHLDIDTGKEESVVKSFAYLFDGGLGCLTKTEAKLQVKESATPKFFNPRPVPLAIQSKVEAEIEHLVKIGVLCPVDYSDWGTPIVPVLKKNGQVRICGDFKVTLNPQLVVEKYPLPRIEDIFAKLNGGTEFSKLDMSMAYQQIRLDEESKKLTTISTSKGLFRYERLVYGLASAPGIFQKIMDKLLIGLDGVVVFLDDILITAPNRRLHTERLHRVLTVLQNAGLKLAREKCVFFADKLKYLGHIIDRNGLHTCPDKVKDIELIPYPSNVKELQSFLGVINFYRKFLPDVATICAPLYQLLKISESFEFNREHRHAVDTLKQSLKNNTCLAYFDPSCKTKITVDASPIGVAAILSQVQQNGCEVPIEFASRKLSEVEQRYSQLDREALAILFGVQKFHHYVYGRRFTLVTDNKPLEYIFGPKKGIPVMAANRLQRIAIALSGYTFDMLHVKSKENVADYFSRNPLRETPDSENEISFNVALNYFMEVNKLPITVKKISDYSVNDPILQKVNNFVMAGWPEKCDEPDLRPFFLRKSEIYEEQGCLFWGYRIIIPKLLRQVMCEYLHETHMGINKIKSMARESCWWPNQTNDLENVVKHCDACLLNRNNPPKNELISWNWPKHPWTRIHIDFFGPFMKRWCLVVVDSYSKWVECIDMGTSTTAINTIVVLRDLFARFGLPRELISDNGTVFVSREFHEFLSMNGIKHITSPVGHPATNGQAENTLKTIKNALKKSLYQVDTSQFKTVLYRFLLDYRNTKHASTGVAPAQLMFKRQLRTRLDLINPHRKADLVPEEVIRENIVKSQMNQKKNYKGSKHTHFSINDLVMVKDYSIPGKVSWSKCNVEKIIGKQTYLVRVLHSKKLWKRHANQIVKCNSYVKQPLNDKFYTPDFLNDYIQPCPIRNEIEIPHIVQTENEEQPETIVTKRYNLRPRK